MKLKKGFITHDTDACQIMVDTGLNGFAGMVRSNRTAAFIVDCLKQDTTAQQIVDAMLERYDAPREKIEADVDKVIGQLRGIGALED